MDNNPLPQRPKQSLHIPEDQRYVYQPIKEAKSVRFLILQPGSGSDPLIGGLQLGSLDAAELGELPPYEAISYVWGTSDRLATLLCDGAVLPLTQSIRDALVRVRLPDRARRLWADQICINQDDVAERSQQVKLMNAVYKNASKVLVWLGRDADGVAADAVRMVHYLDGVFKDDEAHEAFKVAHEEHLAMQSAERWIPLAKLTKLPWFHRIWIVQEIGTTAPATLYWGDVEMDWDTLSFVAGILNERYHHLRTRFFIGTSNIRYLRQRFVEPAEAHDSQFHNRGTFAYELHRARHLLAQDPRDHVYAFLGHFSLTKGGSKELRGLVADYSKSVEEVYLDVAVRGLRGADDLIMLSATHHSRPNNRRRAPGNERHLDLPSWVPDWRDLPMHILGSPAVPHRASGDTRPELTIDEEARVLHIRGVRVDVVERHSWTIYGTAFQVRQDDQGSNRKNDQYVSRTHPMEVLWKQICGFQTFTLSRDYSRSAFFALIQTLTNACTGMDRSRPYSSVSPNEWLASGAAYLQTPISPSIHALSLTGDPFKWSHEATLITRYRRFAVTRGGYFVLGPDALQEGDVVVLLRGGKTPFLLREVHDDDDGTASGGGSGGGWVLVGECYVHGLMDGEGWVGKEDGGREEVFSIR
ncbi:HET-domain-containing protein [Trichoderma citrinoviride]|uniref:HET-domain-containing protein n=1 Tax=Trichoderma citrinoviride TaxID=58853 RepID=A0A2T4B3C0_9HYPO|nr:HET-domain-containing protein [Trichoderma citrinoviride]PTB63800.1 HET-domain-containing protein [Trichoderma citrinoviride]